MLVSILFYLAGGRGRKGGHLFSQKKKTSTVTKAGYLLEDTTSDWCPLAVQDYALEMLYVR